MILIRESLLMKKSPLAIYYTATGIFAFVTVRLLQIQQTNATTTVWKDNLKLTPVSRSLARVDSEEERSSSSEESSVECCSATSGQQVKTGSLLGGGMEEADLVHVEFEVHGRVQGVFFRKHTQSEGRKLGLRGFCRNTSSGTVSGGMEGPRSIVNKMKHWLEHTGSPMSRISKVVFTNEAVLPDFTYPPGFDIKRTI